MQSKKRVYVYPFTKVTTRAGGNSYIPNVMAHLGRHFDVVNKQTSLGLLDVLLKMPRCQVLYFNWIEDVADKKFGALQVMLLRLILWLAKRLRIKIVWFVHNNLSHKKKNLALKNKVVQLMTNEADVVLTHSAEADICRRRNDVQVFDHPVEAYQPVAPKATYDYDLLIWGTVTPYKGVEEFLTYNYTATQLQTFRILIAGKFASPDYFQTLMRHKAQNIFVEDQILSEAELAQLFSACRYVLFTYNSTSVLSSAALCKTLVYGKTIIGPAVGAFKELGAKGLIYNYTSFEDLEQQLPHLASKENDPGYSFQLQQYIEQHSWPAFARFVANAITGAKQPQLYAVT